MDTSLRIFHLLFNQELHFLFKILCLKEYLVPNRRVKKTYRDSPDKNPSLAARTMYWLAGFEPSLLFADNKLAEFMSMEDGPKKAKTLSEWISKHHGTHIKFYTRMANFYARVYKKDFIIDRIFLPSIQYKKPNWFIQFKNANDTCVLYFHGGGYIMGNNVAMLPAYIEWFKKLQVNAFSATYNFAHDLPLNTIIEKQGMDAYNFLVKKCGINPKRLILMGESAGGNMVLNLAKKVGKDGCACVIAVSPWLDLTLSQLDTMKRIFPYDSSLSNRLLDMMKILVSSDPDAAKYSPTFWTDHDLNQLPPLFLTVSRNEKMYLDCSNFIERLKNCPDVELQFEADKLTLVHAYVHLNGFIREAKESLSKMTKFVLQHAQIQ